MATLGASFWKYCHETPVVFLGMSLMQMYFQIIKWLHLQPFSRAESQMCHSFPVIIEDGVDWVTFCPEMQEDLHLVPTSMFSAVMLEAHRCSVGFFVNAFKILVTFQIKLVQWLMGKGLKVASSKVGNK